ncbi:hypothetical protein [Massilia sp. PWRC2]|uniref:hypothetical protein n=1 Tax=Massilia sp. PWRC2 TaxID=2804626 RepID=UPI003CF75A9B
MRPQSDIDDEAESERQLDRVAASCKAGADIVEAIRQSRKACEAAGLNATFAEDGVAYFSPWQTAKTIRHAREDAAATLMVQLAVLRRLDRLRNLAWVAIALLAYLILR